MKKYILIVGLLIGSLVCVGAKAQTASQVYLPSQGPVTVTTERSGPTDNLCNDTYERDGIIFQTSGLYTCPVPVVPVVVQPTTTPVTVQIDFVATSSTSTADAFAGSVASSSTDSTSAVSVSTSTDATTTDTTDTQTLIESLKAQLASLMSQLIMLLEAQLKNPQQ